MTIWKRSPMNLEKSPRSHWKSLLPAAALLCVSFATPGLSQEREEPVLISQGSRTVLSGSAIPSSASQFQSLLTAVELAKVQVSGRVNPADAARIDQAASVVCTGLSHYPVLSRVHSHEEPTWITDRGDLTALAVLALAELEQASPDPKRRERLTMLSDGLVALQRKQGIEYPYGAHVSWRNAPPLTRLNDGSSVPSAFFRSDNAYAVEALTRASQVLSQPRYLESAKREALGMATHLVIHGQLIHSFSPQPEPSTNVNDALPIIAGFVALFEATGERAYSDLAALATRWVATPGSFSGPEWERLKSKMQDSPSAALLSARAVGKPVTFQYVEAEKGKVVNKAIEGLGYTSSAGNPGNLAVMGQENTFWMRFDVPTEDDYLFDLSYVQSDIGGGLVSVMMRIDGDKIFQVPLGDVDGEPIFRRKYVDGPRPLRSGPHSFGIRFSGLLMTKPALLDSVVVQPALERREFDLPGNQRLYLMRNVTDKIAKTDVEHFASWPPLEAVVVSDTGANVSLGADEDKRRRKKFVTVPPNSVALVKVKVDAK